jgi:hypothetical protein
MTVNNTSVAWFSTAVGGVVGWFGDAITWLTVPTHFIQFLTGLLLIVQLIIHGPTAGKKVLSWIKCLCNDKTKPD